MKKTVQLNQFNNNWFDPGKNALVQVLWYFTNAVIFNSSFFPLNFLKLGLLRLFGSKIGKGVVIKPNVNIKFPWKLQIGDYSWIGEGVWIDNLAEVKIENNCCISQGAMLLCGNHDFKKNTFDLMVGKIYLCQGSWVGAKAIVCPGVTLYAQSILTVGSVANKDLSENGIYSGNPAGFKKERIIS